MIKEGGQTDKADIEVAHGGNQQLYLFSRKEFVDGDCLMYRTIRETEAKACRIKRSLLHARTK